MISSGTSIPRYRRSLLKASGLSRRSRYTSSATRPIAVATALAIGAAMMPSPAKPKAPRISRGVRITPIPVEATSTNSGERESPIPRKNVV